jgi:hypothetical protein
MFHEFDVKEDRLNELVMMGKKPLNTGKYLFVMKMACHREAHLQRRRISEGERNLHLRI